MEKKGLLDRRQLEPSPTPPDVHVNFSHIVRGGAFQPRGVNILDELSQFQAAPISAYSLPREYKRSPFEYADRPGSSFDYEKELEDYGSVRKRRTRREYSPMSRSSSSPPRRLPYYRSESPDSIRIKLEKRKKRKHSSESPPPRYVEVRKKEKKKKKDKKYKKMKAAKGTMDFGYDSDGPAPPQIPPGMVSKEEFKLESKERKRLEKLEKIKKKAEKKLKKLEKIKLMQEKLEAEVSRSIKVESNLETSENVSSSISATPQITTEPISSDQTEEKNSNNNNNNTSENTTIPSSEKPTTEQESTEQPPADNGEIVENNEEGLIDEKPTDQQLNPPQKPPTQPHEMKEQREAKIKRCRLLQL